MSQSVTFALIADAHVQGHDRRHLPQIVDQINSLSPLPDFVVSLGDNVYGLAENDIRADMCAHHGEIGRLRCPHHYVLGGHDLDAVEAFGQMTWPELLRLWEMPGRWYGFDCQLLRCLVTDSCSYLQQPQQERVLETQAQWLDSELAATAGPVVIFTHEALGFEQWDLEAWVAEDNRNFWPEANPLQLIIQQHADRIAGVFAGHKHRCLHKLVHGVNYHLAAAAYQHGGQFAEVIIGIEGPCQVRAHPHDGLGNPERTLQESYVVEA